MRTSNSVKLFNDHLVMTRTLAKNEKDMEIMKFAQNIIYALNMKTEFTPSSNQFGTKTVTNKNFPVTYFPEQNPVR